MRRVIQPLRPACCGTNYRKSAKPLQQPRRKRSCLRRARERGRPRHARFVRARKLVTCVVTIWSGFFFFFLMPFRSSFAFCLRGARRAPQAQACKCLLHISIGRRLKRIEKTRHEGNHTVQREYIRMATFLLRRNSCFTQIAGPILLSLQSMDAKKKNLRVAAAHVAGRLKCAQLSQCACCGPAVVPTNTTAWPAVEPVSPFQFAIACKQRRNTRSLRGRGGTVGAMSSCRRRGTLAGCRGSEAGYRIFWPVTEKGPKSSVQSQGVLPSGRQNQD